MKVLRGIFISLLMVFLVVLGLGPLLHPHRGLLFSENRPARDFSELKAEDLWQGSYFTNLNEVLQDNQPLRQDLISWKANFQGRVLRRPVVNNVYWKGKALLAYVNGIQTDSIAPDESVKDMGDFYQKLARLSSKEGADFVFVGLPNHTQAFAGDYPFYMDSTDFLSSLEDAFQRELDKKGVDSLFLRDQLLKDPAANYLKTDHHLQARGALLAGQEILQKLNPEGTYDLARDYRLVKDSRPFVGSRSRKIPGLGVRESFYYPLYKGSLSYRYRASGKDRPILVRNPQKKTVDYGVYMGGDVGYGKVETDNEEGLKLLIYGDSYTNALESVLVPYCKKLTSFDFRYGNKEEFFQELESGDYDYVLCIRDSSMYLKKSPNGRFF